MFSDERGPLNVTEPVPLPVTVNPLVVPSVRLPCCTDRVNCSAVPLVSVILMALATVNATVPFWLTVTDVGAVITGATATTATDALPLVTSRIRLFAASTMKTSPAGSMATPVGSFNTEFVIAVPSPAKPAELFKLLFPAKTPIFFDVPLTQLTMLYPASETKISPAGSTRTPFGWSSAAEVAARAEV